MILAIDPGPTESAWVQLAGDQVLGFAKESNDLVIQRVATSTASRLAIEMIASYGMPVGREVFETCVWIGRFAETWDVNHVPQSPARFITRMQAKMHMCNSAKAKDANVRQALIDRWGPGKERAIGKKASPGPLYGVSDDVWQALAVGVYDYDIRS